MLLSFLSAESGGNTMVNKSDWIAAAISKARQQRANAPDAIWTELEVLLKDKLSQRPIPAGELASVAMQLIHKIETPQTDKDGRENQNH